ncbi:GNAT family N-acetyltransferase [Cohnella sp. WQ 127256]|uniref:GNAT family N-acetyltransferase n=1 Tax=Cohnella sp. WQ 127256 TaxID=2938790 RepID=UPI002119351B|nr:GNAT family N-acetyltransferase [Cohnella sp. WQ 127256]
MLTEQQLIAIEQLQKECESFEPIQLKLNWEMLKDRGSNQLDFLHYENDELVAFLGLYAFGSTVEVCGMVKPSERRNGYFQQLLQQGMERVKQNEYKKILLNSPSKSDGGKAFLLKQGAAYAFSEHQMEWQEVPILKVEGVTLRPAIAADFDMRIRLSIEAFGEEEADAIETENMFNKENDTEMLMINVGGETIGKIRVSVKDGQAWIYGFCILPEQQGKGIGRKVLRQVIIDQSSAGHSVHLEVETKNDHALGLYESVGFKSVHTQDYYTYTLKQGE